MNKHIIQAFIVLILILFGVSLVSESNARMDVKKEIAVFEEKVENEVEVENGNMAEISIIEEDSSNLISDINARVACIVVGGLNKVFNIVLKLIASFAN